MVVVMMVIVLTVMPTTIGSGRQPAV